MLKKVLLILVAVLIISALCFGEVQKTVKKIKFKDQREKLSYSIGLDIGRNLKKQEIDVDTKLLLKGLTDGLSGTTPSLTEEEIKEVFTTFQKDMETKQNEKKLKLAEKNKTEGEAFLAANKTKEGVITLPSGLQYKELTPGTGPSPTAADTVTVNYRGTLVDGTEFDSSYKRGEPLKIGVSGVIPAWTEALQLMKVGAKWQLFIPANLAYGVQGAGPVIGPNAVLIFEVELLGIEPKTDTPK
jgi:FKBP-type peptidyl-prolyl cis-trans isomerase FklB